MLQNDQRERHPETTHTESSIRRYCDGMPKLRKRSRYQSIQKNQSIQKRQGIISALSVVWAEIKGGRG